MITLRSTDWHVKLFQQTEEFKSRFHGPYYRPATNQTNLCYFVRTLLVYLPFIFLMHAAAIVMPIWALTIYPHQRFNIAWWIIPAWIIGSAIVIILIVVLAAVVSDLLKPLGKKTRSLTWQERQACFSINVFYVQPAREEARAHTAWGLFLQYLKARKEKICPMIKIERVQS